MEVNESYYQYGINGEGVVSIFILQNVFPSWVRPTQTENPSYKEIFSGSLCKDEEVLQPSHNVSGFHSNLCRHQVGLPDYRCLSKG